MTTAHNASAEGALFTPFSIFQAVATVFLITLTEVGNILTLTVVIKYKSLRKQKFLFIPSLAAADALAGLGVALNSIQTFEHIWCVNYLGGTLTLMAPSLGLVSSHLHIEAVALERFIAITFPFKYNQWVTVRRIYVTIAVIWTYTLVYTLTLLSWGWEDPEEPTSCGGYNIPQDYIIWSTFPYFLLILLTLIVTYSRIFRVAQRKIISVAPAPVVTVATIQEENHLHHVGHNLRTDEHQPQRHDNRKVSKYIAAVIGAYLITWTMFFVSRVVRSAYPAIGDSRTYYIISYVALDIALSNSALNVFIYACFLSEFRQAYRNILCCMHQFANNRFHLNGSSMADNSTRVSTRP